MRSILEELFYGNVCPNTDCRNNEKETKELMGYIADSSKNSMTSKRKYLKSLMIAGTS